jgi:hypothetical protein
MPANFVLLEKITVGAAGASSVTFSGIPQTGYTDLVVKYSVRSSTTDQSALIRFNGSSTGYSEKSLYGTGSAAASYGQTASSIEVNYATTSSQTASTFANGEMYIPNYTSSNYKSVSIDDVQENNATAAYAILNAGLWSNTAAITSISITAGTSFVQYSTFYLYGVAKLGTTPAIVPYATGGDTIMTDGTYWYHTFISSGTFTPQKAISCDYLVVAGGGSGGSSNAGGGGAGGYLTSTGYSVSSGTSYTVTVGAGAAAATYPGNKGTNGNNSVFATITATGGGGGGSYAGSINVIVNGNDGGSGGGASSYAGTTAGTAGSASPSGQGNAGGGAEPSGFSGGGGGGAGAVGVNGGTIFNTGGAGGAGLSSSITGTAITRAGGGGGGDGDGTGGAGGSGGGGAGSGSSGTSASNGSVNTGGGGGGSGFATSGAGGSGIVIIRYAV